MIQSIAGEYVGAVEPKLGQRLIKLMDGGNEYIAAISALDTSVVRLFIRETFQHASQTGKLSFPPTVTETVRPYVKGRLLHRDTDDDEAYLDDSDEPDEWSRGEEPEEPRTVAHSSSSPARKTNPAKSTCHRQRRRRESSVSMALPSATNHCFTAAIIAP